AGAGVEQGMLKEIIQDADEFVGSAIVNGVAEQIVEMAAGALIDNVRQCNRPGSLESMRQLFGDALAGNRLGGFLLGHDARMPQGDPTNQTQDAAKKC